MEVVFFVQKSNMASFTNRVTSITQNTILPKVYDNVLNDNFMTYRYVGTAKKWSGVTLDRPIMYQKNSLGSSFSGLDTFATSTVETRLTMSFDPRGYSIPVVIPGMERAVNNVSESQVISLVKTEIETAEMSMLDDLGSMFYADGTGNANKDFLGLDALNDDSTSVVTLGGLSRTTYPILKGTRTASSGTLTLAKLATLFSAVSGGSSQKQRPTVITSSEAEFDLYDSLLAPTVRANYDAQGGLTVTRTSKGAIPSSQLKGSGGYTALVYRGIPWVADEKAPAQTIWFNNENYLDFFGLSDPELESIGVAAGDNIEGVYTEAPSQYSGIQWTGFMKPVNQYGMVAHIIMMGNLLTFQPRRHGRLTGVTGV